MNAAVEVRGDAGGVGAPPTPTRPRSQRGLRLSGRRTDDHHVDQLVTDLVLAYLANRDVETESGPWPRAEELVAAEAEIAEIMAACRETKRGGTRALQVVEELEEDVAKLRAERNDCSARTPAPA